MDPTEAQSSVEASLYGMLDFPVLMKQHAQIGEGLASHGFVLNVDQPPPRHNHDGPHQRPQPLFWER